MRTKSFGTRRRSCTRKRTRSSRTGTSSECRSAWLRQCARRAWSNLNQLLADTITLRDLYKKHHWQVAGPTFYQLHLLFDKHSEEQNELVDAIAERIQLLGGVSLAMAPDVAETTLIPRPPEAAAKRCRSRSRGCCTRTRSSSRRRARWPSSPPSAATTAPTTCW